MIGGIREQENEPGKDVLGDDIDPLLGTLKRPHEGHRVPEVLLAGVCLFGIVRSESKHSGVLEGQLAVLLQHTLDKLLDKRVLDTLAFILHQTGHGNEGLRLDVLLEVRHLRQLDQATACSAPQNSPLTLGRCLVPHRVIVCGHASKQFNDGHAQRGKQGCSALWVLVVRRIILPEHDAGCELDRQHPAVARGLPPRSRSLFATSSRHRLLEHRIRNKRNDRIAIDGRKEVWSMAGSLRESRENRRKGGEIEREGLQARVDHGPHLVAPIASQRHQGARGVLCHLPILA
mmetsp:Transcript_44490/g.108556  ORF Transcript_44490/g.108556 Transcript_44490/m.108556 type:complete len:289 (-) Transcript_44490:1575-2441(-)